MSNKEDIDYQHFIDKIGSIVELVQIHLIECPIVKDEYKILNKILLTQDLLVEIKNEIKQIKEQKSNQNES
jgi:hypothetical protein